MGAERWGATEAEWQHFSRLVLPDLLPVVSNPKAVIAPSSKMKGVGKTPSVYSPGGGVVGLPKWTERSSSLADVERWSAEPDYGICIQTRRWRALDVDVDNPELAQRIADTFDLAGACPVRVRRGTGKRLLVFAYEGELFKRSFRCEGGLVELLATGQQFVAIGTHPSGARYEWPEGLPSDVPVLTEAELDAAWDALVAEFAIEGEFRAGARPRGERDVSIVDPVADWIVAGGWEHYGWDRDGEKLFVACPWKDGHSMDSGETEAAWLLAGTRGQDRGEFKCLHASCANRHGTDFRQAIGFEAAQFEDLDKAPVEESGKAVAKPPRKPAYQRKKDGTVLPTLGNYVLALSAPHEIGIDLRYDAFDDAIVWAPVGEDPPAWRPFSDEHYVALGEALERLDFESVGKERLRDCVHSVAKRREIDTAQEWLSRLKWDGVPRVETWLPVYAGTLDNRYTRAVSRYIWTALAGRVIEPGCKADMVPILIGPQGDGKSSLVASMAPSEERFEDTISLSDDEDKTARKMRGVLVVELGEMQGLRSRELEAIKAWVVRRRERWVPKYKEFAAGYDRRCVIIGTSNPEDILDDATGERRWLPVRVGERGLKRCVAGAIRMATDREQLWAEAAELFTIGGVDWEEAEILAPVEHKRFKAQDEWRTPVVAWLLAEDIDGSPNWKRSDLSSILIAREALGRTYERFNRADQLRIVRVMTGLGFVNRRTGKYNLQIWKPAENCVFY